MIMSFTHILRFLEIFLLPDLQLTIFWPRGKFGLCLSGLSQAEFLQILENFEPSLLFSDTSQNVPKHR